VTPTPAPAAALRSDATALDAVAALLGPGPGEAGAGATRTYVVIPSPRAPRYILPVAGRHARGARLRPAARASREVLNRLVIGPALRVGAGHLLPGKLRVPDGTAAGPGLRRHLATLLGQDDVDLAVALGAPRPNRKPVIQVIGADGSTVAWVKVGVDPHTDALVAHEIDALRHHVPAAPVVAPEVLASGEWQGHPLLALGHLPMTEATGDLPLTAAAAQALAGPLTDEGATTGRWWKQLRATADETDPGGPLDRLLDRLEETLGDRVWRFGTWHGDLAPWNATWEGDRLHVWDWERAGGPVPLGLDVVHNRFQVAMLRDGADLAAARSEIARRELPTLSALGYDEDEAPLVVTAYLATLRARYALDERLGPLGPGSRIAAAIDADPTIGAGGPA